ncbi:hypothetical protein VP01_3380g3 [Puccinia sorghi]|uniref:DDE Tnp4 domain-containing protein n=1 Tax=Puccinia sorghi TaxID=27349 RepID=A0A0L6UWS2_9BASI|nr:hypothetical protein VP01_3380g3 [Puccinia sorghi]
MMLDSENKSNSDLEDYFSFCKHQYEKQYFTARGTTTRFHPKYDFWPCFPNLLRLIEPDPIFYNQSQNLQQDVSIQLSVSTCRLGSNGNGEAVLRLKNLFQFGFRTINLYTTQVIKAIHNVQSQLESWPTQEQQVELYHIMQEDEFPGCTGFVDGTMIPLSQKPPIDGNH